MLTRFNGYKLLTSEENLLHHKKHIKVKNNKTASILLKIIYIYFCVVIILQGGKYMNLVYINLEQKVPQIKENDIKIALCTMAKLENLYTKEFVEYYIKLGIDHIFIYDDNDPNTERIIDAIDDKYKPKVTTYENIKGKFKDQSQAYTNCYHSNKNEYDWFLMIDIDEFLFIKNDTLKNYLSNNVLDKCDSIKFHWVYANDNDLMYYDERPLLERFKPPYLKSIFVKSIIRSKIPELLYGIHSPLNSPIRNVSCNDIGEIMDISDGLNIELIKNINIEKALLIHFRYKTAEEFVIKQKRGYSDWFGDALDRYLKANIFDFFSINRLTMEKINYVEKELNLTLTKYKIKYYFKKLFFLN